jgi:hypothetical protein
LEKAELATLESMASLNELRLDHHDPPDERESVGAIADLNWYSITD